MLKIAICDDKKEDRDRMYQYVQQFCQERMLQAEIMEMAAKNMKERLQSAETVMQKDRMMRHDRRHFEALLYPGFSET